LVFLNGATFWAIFFGCATNCFPVLRPALFALVVAAYSDGDNDLIAASGSIALLLLLNLALMAFHHELLPLLFRAALPNFFAALFT